MRRSFLLCNVKRDAFPGPVSYGMSYWVAPPVSLFVAIVSECPVFLLVPPLLWIGIPTMWVVDALSDDHIASEKEKDCKKEKNSIGFPWKEHNLATMQGRKRLD